MKWETPPHSSSGKIKLVCTEKMNGEIYLVLIGDVEVDYCGLHEVGNYSVELQKYVKDILPKIVSGVYDIKLLNKEIDKLGG